VTSNASESIRYRIRRAKETLVEAEAMAQIGHWNACVNRLYYACFYAVTALLLQRNLLSSKHTQVRSLLNRHRQGIDVPAADLAIILASSCSKRQMIQRMGRVVRLKQDGRMDRITLLFVEGTAEDPGDGALEDFVDAIVEVGEDVHVFRASDGSDAVVSYLNGLLLTKRYSWPRPCCYIGRIRKSDERTAVRAQLLPGGHRHAEAPCSIPGIEPFRQRRSLVCRRHDQECSHRARHTDKQRSSFT